MTVIHTLSRLHRLIQQWKGSLTFIQKSELAVGWYPQKPVEMNFPLGGL